MNSAVLKLTIALGCLLIPQPWVLAADPVCLEAEAAKSIVVPAKVVDAASAVSDDDKKVAKAASGEKYVAVPRPKKPKGEANDKPPCFDAKTGTNVINFAFEVDKNERYALWCRVWWTDECGNSFFMTIDDTPVFTFGQDGVYKRWHWIRASKRLKQMVLTKGEHSLQIKIRETGVRLDQILLTRDPKYVPVGIE